MGYTFTIGNAEPEFSKEYFPELYATWVVSSISMENAPSFPNDVSNNKNSRSPSYITWADFCRSTDIWSIFFDERGRLHAGHPGCIGITKEQVDFVSKKLSNYRTNSKLPPGFERFDGDYIDGPRNYDYHLARLIWLEWWMRWAVENCETPAIMNR